MPSSWRMPSANRRQTPGHKPQGGGVVLFAALQQNLTAQADAQQGPAPLHGAAQHLIQAACAQRAHGLARGPHAGKDYPLGRVQRRGIRRDGAGNAQMLQGPAHARLIARLVVQNGQHVRPLLYGRRKRGESAGQIPLLRRGTIAFSVPAGNAGHSTPPLPPGRRKNASGPARTRWMRQRSQNFQSTKRQRRRAVAKADQPPAGDAPRGLG